MQPDPTQLLRRADALASGMAQHELRAMHTSGRWQRIARGTYIGEDHLATLDAESTHRLTVQAIAPNLSKCTVISHDSAAVFHGLPVFDLDFSTVHVTWDRRGGGRVTAGVTRHCAPLGDVTEIDGLAVTSLARTVVDIARTRSTDAAVVVGDAALRAGVGLDEIQLELERARGWKGIAAARRVVELIDGRSESVGESLSRLRLIEHGFVDVRIQVEVRSASGKFIARVDFLLELWVAGEFDGTVKYVKYLRPGQSVSDVVLEEKKREDELRDENLQVVRWVWADLFAFDAVAERIRRAASRAARSPAPTCTLSVSDAHPVVGRALNG